MIDDYNKDIEMTYQHIEQLHIETIIQMAKQKIKKELKKSPQINNKTFHFPVGTAEVYIRDSFKNGYLLEIRVTTSNHSTFSTITYLNKS